MTSPSRRTVFRALACALLALGAAAPTAGATDPAAPVLTYATGLAGTHPQVWVAAADGSGARRLGEGEGGVISPDGAWIVSLLPPTRSGTKLVLRPTAGGPARTLAHAQSFSQATWSPDSQRLILIRGDAQLVTIDVASGAVHVVARGQIQGASFSPDSSRIVYGRAASFKASAAIDVWVANADGSHRHAITHDGRSLFPLWGPSQIAFAHARLRHADAPVFQLQLMDADGAHVRQVSHLHVPKLLSGLVATGWSQDGTRLLAEYVGQDTSEAWTVDLTSGRVRDLTGRFDAVAGFGLSHDGTTVLVQRGSFDDPAHQSIATIPFGGGAAHVLVAHGGLPTWNR